MNVPHTRGCDDGDACTTGDHCQSGSCVGTPVDCDDLNDCTQDICSGGSCSHGFVPGPCDDGSPCTDPDTCSGGVCHPGPFCSGGDQCCSTFGCIPPGLECIQP
jgi:hypothetical protein